MSIQSAHASGSVKDKVRARIQFYGFISSTHNHSIVLIPFLVRVGVQMYVCMHKVMRLSTTSLPFREFSSLFRIRNMDSRWMLSGYVMELILFLPSVRTERKCDDFGFANLYRHAAGNKLWYASVKSQEPKFSQFSSSLLL